MARRPRCRWGPASKLIKAWPVSVGPLHSARITRTWASGPHGASESSAVAWFTNLSRLFAADLPAGVKRSPQTVPALLHMSSPAAHAERGRGGASRSRSLLGDRSQRRDLHGPQIGSTSANFARSLRPPRAEKNL